MLGAPGVRADSGRIAFSGAVVVPTCSAQFEATAPTGGDLSSGSTFTCGGGTQAAAGTDVSSYELSVTHLGADETAGSPLLQYYAGYLASHAAGAQLVTRTYQ